MKEIKDILPQTISQQRKPPALRKPKHLSERQRQQEDEFSRKWKESENVLAFFAPVKWPGVIAKQSHALLYTQVTLDAVDRLYYQGVAKQVVKNNLTGIFSLAEPREPINDGAVNMTAELFCAKYGAELSIFGAFFYFANYLTEYRSSYGRFDLQDVLRQCSKVYLPWWRNCIGRMENAAKKGGGASEQTGKAALWGYLQREYLDKGLDIRDSALYQAGYISEDEVRKIEKGEQITF